MSEEILREIIGLAKKTKWNQIKRYIKSIIRKTLKKNTGYKLTALDVSINGKKKSKFGAVIKSKEDYNKIDEISDFSHLSLYQTTTNSNNLIDISQSNGTIIVLAKYLGPSLKDLQTFNFSVHLDSFSEPFFTIGNGIKIDSSEIIDIIHNNSNIKTKRRKEKSKKISASKKDNEIGDVEAYVFETLTSKNAIWNGSETKTFHDWKAKMKNKYRIETGKTTHYKGKPTKKFSLYLKNLIKEKKNKIKPSKERLEKNKVQSKKQDNQISEAFIFKTLTGKNAIWNGSETKNFIAWKRRVQNRYRKETGKPTYYKGKPTNNFFLYLKNLINEKRNKKITSKQKLDKKKSHSKEHDKQISEELIFETLTGKNAIWNGSETKNFITWKKRIKNKYRKETGKPTYYKGKLTRNFEKYLKNLIKNN